MNSQQEVKAVEDALTGDGVFAALVFLNSRTRHRFTGLYRYDGDTLRNLFLFDRENPALRQGTDLTMRGAFCALLQSKNPLVVGDARRESCGADPASPIIAYCGALVRDEEGRPFGSLCHYDFKPCPASASDAALLLTVAPDVYRSWKISQN